MSKRDDLDNEARGEMSIFGAILLGGGMLVANSLAKNNKKEKLKMQIDAIRNEISRVEQQISIEEGKFFLVRDNSRINLLMQEREKLVKENNDLVDQYNKL